MQERIRRRILFPSIITLFILMVISAGSFYVRESAEIDEDVRRQVSAARQLFDDKLDNDAELLKGLLDFLEKEEKFKTAWLARDREALLKQTAPLLDKIRYEYRVTHFYFHDPDGINFLRVQNPTKFGDKVKRFIYETAKVTGKTSYGIEVGKFGTLTLRRIFPWVIDGEISGYIELGEEIEHITPKLKSILGVDLLVTVNKSLLEQKKWEEGLAMINKEGVYDWNQFNDFVIVDSTLERVPGFLIKNLASYKKGGYEDEVLKIKEGKKVYGIGLLKIFDASKKDIGYMIVLRDVTGKENSLFQLFIILLIVCFSIGGLLTASFYVYLGRIEGKLEEAEKKTKEAAEIKSKFASMVSHELRAPLGPIKEGVNLILDGITGPINDKQRDLLDTVRSSADRLNRLVTDILDFQKLGSGMMEFKFDHYDINEVVKEVCKTMDLVMKVKGLEMVAEIDSEIPIIKFDRDKIVQVLTNLVNNAMKFTEKGSVAIKTQRQDNTVHVAVVDTGPGISQDDIPKLFQSFQQLDTPQAKKAGGTGLGLAISKEIILHHKGKIWVESELGKGSVFQFVLPIRDQRG